MKTSFKTVSSDLRRYAVLASAVFLSITEARSQAPVRIMPLGDSITYGFNGAYTNSNPPGGYRKELGNRLASGGIPYDFVGASTANPAPGIDPDHNGYPGIRTDQVLANIQTWLGVNPDVVLMHLGTNDMIQKVPVATAANNLRSLIVNITRNTPARRVYVATIIPINADRDGYTMAQWAQIVNAYNTQVRNMVQEYAGQGKKVYLVDMAAGLTYTVGTSPNDFFHPYDGTHPTQAGYNQMGAFWYNALQSGQVTPPVVTGPSLLVNGSFESSYASWSASGNQSIQSAGAYSATDGSKLVAFNGGNSVPNGVVSQTIPTVAGSTYTLGFDAGVLAYNTSQQRLLVSATGTSSVLSQVIAISGSGNGTSWFRQNFTFVANNSSTVITFRDQSANTNNIDFLLDNVRVTAGGTSSNPNTSPVAAADSYSTGRNNTLVVPAAGVLGNDTDPQGNPLTAVMDAGTSHGGISLNSSGGFTYTPASGYTGPDSFTYHARDGSLNSNVVTVNITITDPGSPVALTNGGFESGLSGWTATGNLASSSGSPYVATEGAKLVSFNGANMESNGVLSQTFSTTAGRTYTLSFDAGALAFNTSSQTLLVTVTGAGNLLSKSISIAGAGGGTNRWLPQGFSFVADGSSATLAFRDQSGTTNSIDLLLDNVRVNGGAAATPGEGLSATAMRQESSSAARGNNVATEGSGGRGDEPATRFGGFAPGQSFTLSVITRHSSVSKGGKIIKQVSLPAGVPDFKVGQKVRFTIGGNGQLMADGFSIRFVAGIATSSNYSEGGNSTGSKLATVVRETGNPVKARLTFRTVRFSKLTAVKNAVRYEFE